MNIRLITVLLLSNIVLACGSSSENSSLQGANDREELIRRNDRPTTIKYHVVVDYNSGEPQMPQVRAPNSYEIFSRFSAKHWISTASANWQNKLELRFVPSKESDYDSRINLVFVGEPSDDKDARLGYRIEEGFRDIVHLSYPRDAQVDDREFLALMTRTFGEVLGLELNDRSPSVMNPNNRNRTTPTDHDVADALALGYRRNGTGWR